MVYDSYSANIVLSNIQNFWIFAGYTKQVDYLSISYNDNYNNLKKEIMDGK